MTREPRLILLRHAVAEKNVQDRHGGGGSKLHVDSATQLERLYRIFEQFNIAPRHVITAPVRHAEDTASAISQRLGVICSIDNDLQPLYLGVLDGLSRTEAAERYPDAARLMELWREGRLELSELRIPDAEDYREFYGRGQKIIARYSQLPEETVVVGTRSILILLISVLLGRTTVQGGGYREITLEPCSFLTFVKESDGTLSLDKKMSWAPSALPNL